MRTGNGSVFLGVFTEHLHFYGFYVRAYTRQWEYFGAYQHRPYGKPDAYQRRSHAYQKWSYWIWYGIEAADG